VRAVWSALGQTLREIEVVVVIDGPDPATRAVLTALGDDYVALVDDDDEWLPEKLSTQYAFAQTATAELPIVATRLYVRTPRAEFVLPRRLPVDGEPLSEYLTMRRGLFHGDGFIQTSTIMAPTVLLRRVPFDASLRRLQEPDWTLRCLEHDDVGLVYAPDPLVIWYADEHRPRVSFDAPWREQFEWLQRSRSRLTPRAYAALSMSVISSMAAPTRSPHVFFMLLRDARRHGRPSRLDYLTFLQIWWLPDRIRKVLRDRFAGRRRPATAH